MLTTVLMLVGFVVAVLVILAFTPALERWATSAPDPVEGEPEEDYGRLAA